ncbi:hypothetical protein D3C71_2189680 [compost metagenome]
MHDHGFIDRLAAQDENGRIGAGVERNGAAFAAEEAELGFADQIAAVHQHGAV